MAFAHLADFTPLGVLSFLPKFGAFEAVLGFLLISGYSVSISYLREPQGFWVRRCRRIYPIFIASVGLMLMARLWTTQQAPSPIYLILNLLLVNQLFTSTSFLGPAWSLSLEFWLYGLAPFLLVTRPALLRIWVYFSFVSFLAYTACRTLFHFPYYPGVGYGLNLLLLSFIWLCGLRLARKEEKRGRILLDLRFIFALHIAFGASIQLASRMKHHTANLFISQDAPGFALQAMTLWLVYYVFVCHVLPERPAAKPVQLMRFLGDLSYPLYLVHLPIYLLLSRSSVHSPSVYYATALASSAILYGALDLYSRRRHLVVQHARSPRRRGPALTGELVRAGSVLTT